MVGLTIRHRGLLLRLAPLGFLTVVVLIIPELYTEMLPSMPVHTTAARFMAMLPSIALKVMEPVEKLM